MKFCTSYWTWALISMFQRATTGSNPIYTLPPYFLQTYICTMPPFMPRTTKGSHPFNFLTTVWSYACLTPLICTPSHHPWYDNYQFNHEALVMNYFPSSLLDPNILSILFWKAINLHFSLNLSADLSYPHKTTNHIFVVLHSGFFFGQNM